MRVAADHDPRRHPTIWALNLDKEMPTVIPRVQAWAMDLPGVPESIVAEAQRAFLNDRNKVWLNEAPLTIPGNSK